MAQGYEFRFSCRVVADFQEKRARGTEFLEKIWPDLDFAVVVKIFQFCPRRWYVYKNLVKLTERLLSSEYFRSRPDLIMQNTYTHIEYFQKIYDFLAQGGLLPRNLSLTPSDIKRIFFERQFER